MRNLTVVAGRSKSENPGAVRASIFSEKIPSFYIEAQAMIEHLHRLLLDVVKDGLDRQGIVAVNASQALLIYNIGDQELSANDLRSRGYYLGSNVSYNLKKLVELGLLDHQRSRIDKRSVRIKLTESGQEIKNVVAALYEKHVRTVEKVGNISVDEFASMNKSLQRLERFWTDQILYRL